MPGGTSDWAHLIRVTLILAVGLLAFVFVRPYFIPEGFGEYGHYRTGAILDGRDHALQFAGRDDCEVCHDDVASVVSATRHAGLACEGCHGPLAAHAADPSDVRPALPDIAPKCITCHERSAGRPALLPQVASADHSGGEACSSCHVAHAPAMF